VRKLGERMRFTKLLAVATISLSCLAASTQKTMPLPTTVNATTTTSGSVMKKILKKLSLKSLRKSPFSLAYLNETLVASKDADGLNMNHYFYAGYKIDKYHSIRIVPTISTTYTGQQKKAGDYHSEIQSTQVRFYRNGILNEKEHGIRLNAHVRNYFYNDNTREAATGYKSKHRLYVLPSKSYGKLSINGAMFSEWYNRDNKTSTVKRNDYLSIAPAYAINDNWYVSFGFDYYKSVKIDSTATKEYYGFTFPEVGWSKGRLSLTLAGSWTIAQSKDAYDGFTNRWHEQGTVVGQLYYSLF
jgi:hypothetical protein